MTPPETAILLAAGLGTRLRPLTDQVPKPLLRFLDRPVLSYSTELLVRAGVTTLGVNAYHHAEQVRAYAASERLRLEGLAGARVRLEVVEERALQGTGGGAAGVWRALGRPRGPIWIANGDSVFDVDLAQMAKVHRRTGAAATMLCRPAVPGEGIVRVEETGRFVAELPGPVDPVQSPEHAPHGAVTFAGVCLVETAVLEALPEGPGCLVRHGLSRLLARGAAIAVCDQEGFWADLGTPSRYMAATREVLDAPERLRAAPFRHREDRVYVTSSRTVHPSAKLEGPVWIAEGGIVEAGAKVGPWAVVGAGCTVRAGAEVRESVLMDGAVATGWTVGTIALGALHVRAG
jgi:mannose-1-phosphate guanylyltransferase